MCLKPFQEFVVLLTSAPVVRRSFFFNRVFNMSNILFLTLRLRILIIKNTGYDLTKTKTRFYFFCCWGTPLAVGAVNNLALRPQDLNSGLIGPLIVCRRDAKASIVHRVLHFKTFDENESWYFEENINTYALDPSQVDRNDDSFFFSNLMHGNDH